VALIGEEKKAYQREYMRKKRLGLTGSNIGLTKSNYIEVGSAEAKPKLMVGGNGLEPMTSAMSTQCSNQLS
jgi:hypothetical protein